MATPSANRQGRTPSQSQHGIAATPPVSTPFSSTHAAFSPHGPRSSPQIKKSPATSSTLAGASATNIPMNFDSPSAAAALSNLGITGGLDLGLDDGVGSLAGSLGVLRRGDDEERAKKMETILGILKKSKGLVSEAGLARLVEKNKSPHYNIEAIWEIGPDGRKTNPYLIGGSLFTAEITIHNNIVHNVALSFEQSAIPVKHADRASQILYEDLKLRPDQSPLTKTLDQFATNLDRLTSLDKLSVVPHLNLFAAVSGIAESLQRLFEWDVEKLRQEPEMAGKPQEALEMVAMCSRHGRPAIHTRGRIGMSLDYWKQYRLVPSKSELTKDLASTMEKNWGIEIGCEPLGARVFQPVRVSDSWLSAEVEKLAPTDDDLLAAGNGPILDWQEPDNTILPSGTDGKQEHDQLASALATPKLPEVIFKATFNPKIPLPFSVWHQIYQLIGLTPDADFALTTFDSISFPVPPGSNLDPSEPRMIRCSKDVVTLDDKGDVRKIPHRNTLFIYKPVYGRTLEELPFGHPSQLIRMLPTLRQYAFLSQLLESSFNTKLEEIIRPEEQPTWQATTNAAMRDELSAFLDGRPIKSEDDKASMEDTVEMDIVLTAHPVPRLQVSFPFGEDRADVMLEIRLNGHVHVVSQNIISEEDDDEVMAGAGDSGKKRRLRKPQDLGVLLEHLEDLGQWSEWIRKNC